MRELPSEKLSRAGHQADWHDVVPRESVSHIAPPMLGELNFRRLPQFAILRPDSVSGLAR